jgi:acylphosphatase
MAVAARHLIITGRVQGVFYRNWTVDTARALGLVGWVRNRSDGDVEAWVEGPEEAVDRFQSLAHDGPPAARVDSITPKAVDPRGFALFGKRPTA